MSKRIETMKPAGELPPRLNDSRPGVKPDGSRPVWPEAGGPPVVVCRYTGRVRPASLWEAAEHLLRGGAR